MSQYRAGTVTVTSGSAVVTGASTEWSGQIDPGDLFSVVGSLAVYEVASVQSNTQLTLRTNFVGTTESGVRYSLTRDFTPNHDLPYLTPGDDVGGILAALIRKLDSVIPSSGNPPAQTQGIPGTTVHQYMAFADDDAGTGFTTSIPTADTDPKRYIGFATSTSNIQPTAHGNYSWFKLNYTQWQGNWSASKTYSRGDITRSNGNVWILDGAATDQSTTPPHSRTGRTWLNITGAVAGGGGGLASVSTDASITGDGTSGDPLSVARVAPAAIVTGLSISNNTITVTRDGGGNQTIQIPESGIPHRATDGIWNTGDSRIYYNTTNNELRFWNGTDWQDLEGESDLIALLDARYIQTVTTDASITGDGKTTPLAVANPHVKPDWNAAGSAANGILNKPVIPGSGPSKALQGGGADYLSPTLAPAGVNNNTTFLRWRTATDEASLGFAVSGENFSFSDLLTTADTRLTIKANLNRFFMRDSSPSQTVGQGYGPGRIILSLAEYNSSGGTRTRSWDLITQDIPYSESGASPYESDVAVVVNPTPFMARSGRLYKIQVRFEAISQYQDAGPSYNLTTNFGIRYSSADASDFVEFALAISDVGFANNMQALAGTAENLAMSPATTDVVLDDRLNWVEVYDNLDSSVTVRDIPFSRSVHNARQILVEFKDIITEVQGSSLVIPPFINETSFSDANALNNQTGLYFKRLTYGRGIGFVFKDADAQGNVMGIIRKTTNAVTGGIAGDHGIVIRRVYAIY